MVIKVLYHSKSGNTEKVAVSIATATGSKCEAISATTSTEGIDLLFIGDGIYGGKIDASTESLIAGLNASKVKNVAVFGTYGGQKKAIEAMKAMIKAKGINVLSESYGCKGKFWAIFNGKHPDDNDLSKAVQFANRAIKLVKNA